MNLPTATALMSLLLVLTGCARSVSTLQPPGRDQYCSIDEKGTSVLCNGRWLRPAGTMTRITHDPFGLAISPDGRTALAVHDRALSVIDTAPPHAHVRYPSYDKTLPSPIEKGSCMGAAFSPDGRTVYLSGGNAGTIVVFDMAGRIATRTISIDGEFAGRNYVDSFTTDLVLTRDGTRLIALDRGNFRMVSVDVVSGRLVQSVDVGRQPFGLALTPDEKTAYVCNVGLYEYPLVPGVTEGGGEAGMIAYPPYGVPSRASESSIEFQGRTMPGLGSPLVPEAMSVWAVDLTRGKVVAKLKPGYQIGELIEDLEIVGGASPNSVAASDRFAYVSNATNDNIAVIDTATNTIVEHIPIRIDDRIDRWRGLMPFGLALSPDGRRLYVALLSLNAVAVIDTQSRRTLGHIPTGWCPTKVRLSPDGRTLYVVTARGLGAGPNGGKEFQPPIQGTYVGDIQLGSFHAIPVPDDRTLAEDTRVVIENTFKEVAVEDDGRNPLPPVSGRRRSPIKHVVYVTKENRTYDEVFGQLPGGRGDATLARYGEGVRTTGRGNEPIANVTVSPNHLALARRWAVSDNFYCDSDASVHGHRWMIGHICNEWVETNHSTHRELRPFSPAPGRRFPDSSGAYDPEDYNEIGGLWENLARHNVNFYNMGQSNEFAGVSEEWNHTDTGLRMPVLYPMPEAVYHRTCWSYPGYNTNIPDQFRMDAFEDVLKERWLSGQEEFPQLLAIILPNDHGADPRPDDGYFVRESFMVDNDLALGRLVQTLSHTRWWKDMVVIVIEDDPQGGVDHVDAHRSVLMMMGPRVKRGYVSHTHANFGAVLRTIYQLLDLPPVNQFDAAASLLQDFFTDDADDSPYTAVPIDTRLFDPAIAMSKYGKDFDWRSKVGTSRPMDNEADQREAHYREQGEPAR